MNCFFAWQTKMLLLHQLALSWPGSHYQWQQRPFLSICQPPPETFRSFVLVAGRKPFIWAHYVWQDRQKERKRVWEEGRHISTTARQFAAVPFRDVEDGERIYHSKIPFAFGWVGRGIWIDTLLICDRIWARRHK
jgi:hypothetical protein